MTYHEHEKPSSCGPALQKMLQAFPHAREKSNGWWEHPDNPTFDFREGEDGSIHIHPWTGRSVADILASHGLKWTDITTRQRGYHRVKVRDSLDIVTLSQAKGIHYHELEAHGLQDGYKYHGYSYVKIPYYQANGEQHTKIKVRKAVGGDGTAKHCWDEGTVGDILPYGLHRLHDARQAGYLLIGEGETDAWACWHHQFPYLGIPGADFAKCLQHVVIADLPERIYILVEPDQMQKMLNDGQGFYKNVRSRLRDQGYTGKLFCIDFKKTTSQITGYKDGYKDPSELHLALWKEQRESEFAPIFQEAIKAALPANDAETLPPNTKQLDTTIASSNLDALLETIPLLARLDEKNSLLYEARIKRAFEKTTLNLKKFFAAVEKERKAIEAEHVQTHADDAEYAKTDAGMVYYSPRGETVPLSNFTAEILSDSIIDDGAEQTRYYDLQATLAQRAYHFEIPAKEFAKCDWADEHLGARAMITTGQSMKSHLVNAIKTCSDPAEHFKYAHTGWRRVDGEMIYLHGGGYISQVSQVQKNNIINLTSLSEFCKSASQAGLEDSKNESSQVSQVSQVKTTFSVNLSGSLARYAFSDDEPTSLQEALQASLRFLDLTKDTVTVPLYCALWRSVLPGVDFGLHLAGQTGWGKTELAALIQQHYGATMDAHQLPGSWESTENSLEMLLFQAKDTVVVVDDFKPKGNRGEQNRLHTKADRVFRSIGNGSTRGRLTSNLEQRAERRPRCMLLSTGEDVPFGASLKARAIILTMGERITIGDSARKLLAAQRDARNGFYAQVMASYIAWLAPHIEQIQQQIPELIVTERNRLQIEGHGRSGTNTANLLLGMKLFLQFAYAHDAITEQEAHTYLQRCEQALRAVADDASLDNAYDKPSEQWRRMLVAAITSKKAHLVTSDGKNPGLEYGWQQSIRNMEINGEIREEETFRPSHLQIGWIDGDDIYVLPSATYRAVKEMGSTMGDEITTLEPTLRKFLVQDQLLASNGLKTPRNTITVRRTLEGTQRDVLHLKKKILFPDETPDSKNDTSIDPSLQKLDSLDSLDFSYREAALQANGEGSQVADMDLTTSHNILDYPEAYLTKDLPTGKNSVADLPTSTIVNAVAADQEAQMKAAYEQVQNYVKEKKLKVLFWRGLSGTEYTVNGYVSVEEYGKRIHKLSFRGKCDLALYELNCTLSNKSA